ncbi:MAG: aspartate kinase [Acidobacteria bacterium]|nr:aspartate kinase [Acidobacteriota bacterium]
MSLIVMKFGGTSVGSAERIRQAASIVHLHAQHEHKIVVVVSALAQVTDSIVHILNAANSGNKQGVEDGLEQLLKRHQQVMAELLYDMPLQSVAVTVMADLTRLRELCSAVLLLGSATPQVMDMALPLGERISAVLFTACLDQLGTDAAFVDSARVLATDDKFGDANPDMDSTRQHCSEVLLPMIAGHRIPVVMGYSGSTTAGQVTTLGRGGSDYSATILAAALDADEVWIWTDVDGVLTADPRICPEALSLPQMTFAEAVELSYYDAKVIHRKAIRPAMQRCIPVWIKNSFRPEAPGTKIVEQLPANEGPVKAVTAVTQASLITLTTHRDIHFAEIFGRLFLRLGHEHVDILFSTQSSSENSLGLVLRQADTDRVVRAIQRLFRTELKHGVLNPVGVHKNVAVIAVLGSGMKGTCGILGRLFDAVARINVSVIAVAQGASELNICFAVDARRATEVLRAVHQEFLSPAARKTEAQSAARVS